MDELHIAFDSLTTTGSVAVDDILEAMSGTLCQKSTELKYDRRAWMMRARLIIL